MHNDKQCHHIGYRVNRVADDSCPSGKNAVGNDDAIRYEFKTPHKPLVERSQFVAIGAFGVDHRLTDLGVISTAVVILDVGVDRIEYRGAHVVTFGQVNRVHERPDGTAGRTFRETAAGS